MSHFTAIDAVLNGTVTLDSTDAARKNRQIPNPATLPAPRPRTTASCLGRARSPSACGPP